LTARLLFRAAADSFLWQGGNGSEALASARSAWETWLLDDGSLHQQTLQRAPSASGLPAPLRRERQHWRHFLRHHPLPDLQLRQVRRYACALSPAPRRALPVSEWSLHATLPIESLGLALISTAVRAGLPPGRRWRSWLADLRGLPRLRPVARPTAPIALDGDRLLTFLGPALEHVVRLGAALGDWVAEAVPAAGQRTGSEEAGERPSESRLRETERRLRFVPASQVPLPARVWRALHYDADRDLLLCRSSQSGTGGYCAVQLDRPLYRYFPRLRFAGRAQGVLVKEQSFLMPTALLDLS